MTPLKLTFDIPNHIAEGLINGTLERVGGVVRDTSTKQVVMWLRDTAINTISSGSIPSFEPVTGVFNLVMQGVNAGISINGFKAVNQRLDLMQGVLTVTSAASILNLGVSVIGFTLIAQRLKELENRLQKAQEFLVKIDRKIDLSFYANFRAALDLAINAFTMSKGENRRSSALNAINRFLEAQHIYLDYADKEFEQKSQIADEYLLTLCLAYIAEARCYLELEEFETAARRFQEGKVQIYTRIEKYVDTLLTSNPSMYLHPKLKGQIDLSRLTRIYQWKNPILDENSVFEIIRDDIGGKSLIDDDQINSWIESLPASIIEKSQIKRGFWKIDSETRNTVIGRLPIIMEDMESIIETNYRFEAYEIEVKALSKLSISFHEWLKLQPEENKSKNNNLMYIIPDEPLDLS
jgi:tetratricopeptide (TPR) repeat protein